MVLLLFLYMKDFKAYIIEKLTINKDTKIFNDSIFYIIENVINKYFSKSKLKYTVKLLNIEKQSLYTRTDWNNDNFLRLEILSYITEDRFKKITLDIKDLIDKENIKTNDI